MKNCALGALGSLLDPQLPCEAALRAFSILGNLVLQVGSSQTISIVPKKGWDWTSWINSKDALENSLFLMLLGPQVFCAAFRLFWNQ